MTVWNTLLMSDPMLDRPKHLTESEYLALGENNYRQELFDGELRVSNANNAHTEISIILRSALVPAARRAGLTVRLTPNLRLSPSRYLIPDVAVGTFGRTSSMNSAADAVLVAEITSPSTASIDRREKKKYYAEAGVGWYLLVEPDFAGYESVTLLLLRLEAGEYAEHAVAKPGEVLVSALPFPMALSTDDLVGF
ncbi:Uma2 family endonuclease [Actinoplanes sp. NPDC051513]|uniref:Uma2 family endonuclease n=1 Tax=Actinoplanes sp. NPDC051513 TaxID=3363908 RepID=UPI0037A9FF0A